MFARSSFKLDVSLKVTKELNFFNIFFKLLLVHVSIRIVKIVKQRTRKQFATVTQVMNSTVTERNVKVNVFSSNLKKIL